MIDNCLIPETNLDNVQYYKVHTGKDVTLEFYLSGGTDNSKVFLKFHVCVANKSFHYWVHPKDDWLKQFCQTGHVSIIDSDKNILANLDITKVVLTEILSEVPQCKELLK